MQKVAIIGSGAWGSALAYAFSDPSFEVYLWGRNESIVNEINTSGKNTKYIGDAQLAGIKATTSLQEAVEHTDIVINALPAFAAKDIFREIKPYVKNKIILINASKGINPLTHQFPFEIFNEIFLDPVDYFSLSGPSFAQGILRGDATALVIAGKDHTGIKHIKNSLKNKRVYLSFSTDIIGVEWGGIYKNVLAIAVGLSEGLGYSTNTQALIFTAGFNEMMEAGIKIGAQKETFFLPSGIGDLMLSSSMKSRNFSFGYNFAKGETNPKGSGIVEGYTTLQSLGPLRDNYNLILPLATMIEQVILHNIDYQKVFSNFLTTYE